MTRAMRCWPVTLILMLLPLWCSGLFGRWYWTPDEPREADIAWNMVHQQQKAVPEMAGVPFCEKPPIAYWASGASLAVFGKTPAAARLPNLLWAIIAVLAIAWLAHGCGGAPAALAAGVATATFSLSFQVSIWLASDAPLVAGVCVALLGAFRGAGAPPGRQKLAWYTLMHAGLALGFLAKSAMGLVVPGLALMTFLLWERRWRELLRWELAAGLLLQAVVVGSWLQAVAAQPDGQHFLKVFLWDNLVGRFLPVASEGHYADGHHNAPFKYLIELPIYLLPWTFLMGAAAYRGWRGVRDATVDRAAWRWCVCVVVPSLVVLSAASTGRGIYLAPLMPGFAVALGLWVARHLARPDRFERACLWLTMVLVALAALVAAPGILAVAGLTDHIMPSVPILVMVLGGSAAAAVGLRMLWHQHRGAYGAALCTAMLALNLTLLVAWYGLFPLVDRWQDLTPTVTRVAALTAHQTIVLWQPDETIVANLDYLAGLRLPSVTESVQLHDWSAREPKLLVLVRLHKGAADPLLQQLGFTLSEQLTIPCGRMYGIFSRTPSSDATVSTLPGQAPSSL